MRRKEILTVTRDIKYILPIQGKLLEIYDGSCNFALVSEPDKLDTVLGSRNFDVLIVDKALYDDRLRNTRFTNVLILTDEGGMSADDGTERLNIQFVNKYSSVKEVINEITSCSVLRDIIEDKGVTTKLVVVYSPIGGSGTTTLAIGLSAVLTKKHKKVLYQNIGRLQNFAFRFANKSPMSESVVKNFKETDNDFYENIKRNFREEVFNYIPPFPRSLSSLDINDSHIVQAITKIKETGIYDYIVIDTATDMSGGTSELMAMADNVLIVGRPDAGSRYKLDIFLKGIDCSDKDRFLFVMNFGGEDNSDSSDIAIIEGFKKETTAFDPKITTMSVEDLCDVRDIERLGIMFI